MKFSTTEQLSSLPQDQRALTHTVQSTPTSIQSANTSIQHVSSTVESLPTDVQALGNEILQGQKKTPIPLTSFTCFDKLPIELRQHVWHLSIQPRFVTIWDYEENITRHNRLEPNPSKWKGQTDAEDVVPVTSRICHDSRAVFLREYRLYIPHDKHRDNLPIYVNTSIDTVYLRIIYGLEHNAHQFIGRFRQFLDARIKTEEVEKQSGLWRQTWDIKHLAFLTTTLEYFYRNDEPGKCKFHRLGLLQNFPELQDLVFIQRFPSLLRHTEVLAVRNPTNTDLYESHDWWEQYMSYLGWMKSEEHNPIQSYPNWSNLCVSVAQFTADPESHLKGHNAITDRRGGLRISGPMGYFNPNPLTESD